jgi:hypothetical protein
MDTVSAVTPVRRGSPDPTESPTAGLPSVTAACKRAENPSALEETFGHGPWLGRETGHNYRETGHNPPRR